MDGPSASAAFAYSFPQPNDLDEEETDSTTATETENEEEQTGAAGEDGGDREETECNELEAVSITGKGKDTHGVEPVPKKYTASSHVTVPERAPKSFVSRLKSRAAKSPPPTSFTTAREAPATKGKASLDALDGGKEEPSQSKFPKLKLHDSPNTTGSGTQPRSSNGMLDQSNRTDSTVPLLLSGSAGPSKLPSPDIQPKISEANPEGGQQGAERSTGLVKFNLDEQPVEHPEVLRAKKINQAGSQRIWKRLRRGTARPGEIVKMEKMLVRVETTAHDLPEDFDENDSSRTETRLIEKWREYVIVCRESSDEESQFSIQMYKTRVIPATEQTHAQKRLTYELPLSHKSTRVNLYSTLDKTLVIWLPRKNSQTVIYILRTRSAASAVEWYTFIRNALGWQRTSDLVVNVPDLSITLQLQNPFSDLEASLTEAQRARADDETIQKTMDAEKAVASQIVQRSLKMLENNPEWADVLAAWLAREKVGLAWKRYDRLEWIHGINEQRMYGTMAMQRTHELELRPKDHYPTSVVDKDGTITEPAPVEGFLIRLTSQKGHVRRFGKMYFKRLYFAVHDQYLVYTRPAKALPPPPPRLATNNDGSVPGAKDIVDKTPLIFAVNPFPDNNQDGEVDWIQYGSRSSKERHNYEAYKEAERKINTMLHAEGYINLSHVVRVQNAQRGNSPADANIDQGPDVDFHEEVSDTTADDGKTSTFDDDRTFELVMRNKLVIRLQAFNKETKKEWVTRLRRLVHYWKLRLAADMVIMKSIRNRNLSRLDIDEEMEAYLGQYARKWEVTRSVASPKLFNICGIACCRAITLSGSLYYKARRHAIFSRCSVVLCHGTLLIFHSTLRSRSGQEIRHIQHSRQTSIGLGNCYIYSGLITETDLLYQNMTFDSNHPGHHALPRVYLEDGWTSTDEDTMTCFVIWQPRNKSWFRALEEKQEDGAARDPPGPTDTDPNSRGKLMGNGIGKGRTRQRLRYVSRLGVPGRSIVFKTRSRTERDHWVLSIGREIERLQAGEDIRVV